MISLLRVRLLSIPLLLAVLALLAFSSELQEPARMGSSQTGWDERSKPNIIFILADDLRVDEAMRLEVVQGRVAEKGATFNNAFVTNSLCCPSRTTFMRGQYPHNHSVLTNIPPSGGYSRFSEARLGRRTIATGLDRAGYRTAYIGKFLNGYRAASYPPGWDNWRVFRGMKSVNVNGELVARPAGESIDEWSGKEAVSFVRRQAGGSAPFFLFYSPHAVHTPMDIPPRYAGSASSESLPYSPAFDEANVADKAAWVARKPRVGDDGRAEYETMYRDRIEAMGPVAASIGEMISVLRSEGELKNTFIIFTSDNGYHLGEHRLRDKRTPYEEAIRIPFYVRGPGIAPGSSQDALILNNDFAPTIFEWTGITQPRRHDGRSFAPLLSGGAYREREAFLIEHYHQDNQCCGEGGFDLPTYDAVRTRYGIYVEYETGEREYYDFKADPHQLESKTSEVPTELVERLEALKACAGDSCRSAENQ